MASSRDGWLTDYDSCALLGQEIMEKINDRNKHQKNSTSFSKASSSDPTAEDTVQLLGSRDQGNIISAHVRTSLRQFSADIERLRQDLMRAGAQHHIVQREAERRQVMLDQLVTKQKQLEEAFKNEGRQDPFGGRSALFDQGMGTSRDPWATDESDDTRGLTVGEIRQQQQHMIREQDQGLEALSHVLGRQKQMALDIGNEVDYQNELIDDITDQVDHTDQRLIRETRHIKVVDRKSNTCCMWVIVIFLFVAIVVIAVVPYHGKP